MSVHRWTEEQKMFLVKHYQKHSRKELLHLLNAEFHLDIKLTQLVACLKNHSIYSGRTGRYEKGYTPFNKGLKGVSSGGVETQFKKGHKPFNYKQVGSERVERDGYILVKVSDKGPWHKRWKMKHRVVWESVNGPIPTGHCLIFLDRDKQNVELSNLQVISKAQLARLNQNDLISEDPEVTGTGIIISEIYTKMGKLNNKRA